MEAAFHPRGRSHDHVARALVARLHYLPKRHLRNPYNVIRMALEGYVLAYGGCGIN